MLQRQKISPKPQKRFLFLQEFGRIYHLQHSLYELAYQWMLAGFPPGTGADEYSIKITGIPPEALLCTGNPACRQERESKFCMLTMPDKVYYLAYNRKYALNKPAAVWVVNVG